MKHSACTLAAAIIFLISPLRSYSSAGLDALPRVDEADLSEIDPALFSAEEWYMPYYLRHFAAVANSVVDTGSDRGYFGLSVWRGSRNHHTYNARVMEGILSLVWFYCTDRPWNPYHGDPALKKRIEASLQFWCRMQHEDGRFSEYGDGEWNLAATAFATKFVGRALWLLDRQGPQIDADVFEQALASLRKAVYIGLTHEGLWEHGRTYANQYANLWGGALAYLDMRPDEEIERLLKARFRQSMTELQSPVGFFYEKGGPDWGYNLSTHHSDLQVAWEYADDELRDLIIKKTRDWYAWFSYNAVKEPDRMLYYLNRGVETRQHKGVYINTEVKDPAIQRWVPQAEFVPAAHAFEMSAEEVAVSNKRQYQEMLDRYPEVDGLEVGEFNAFTPYAFLHHNMRLWHPSRKQKEEAVANLPYLKESSFINIMHDERSNTGYAFIRTPAYYAIFNSGKIITRQQRFGLGLIWTPELGTFFQSQSRTDKAAYGTKPGDAAQVYEAFDLIPRSIMPPLASDQEFTATAVSYPLGDHGEKTITFDAGKISVEVHHAGRFTEILPLLVPDTGMLSIRDGRIRLEGPEGSVVIQSSAGDGIAKKRFETDSAGKECQVIEIPAENSLTYEFIFHRKDL